jgi:hypothetical protein
MSGKDPVRLRVSRRPRFRQDRSTAASDSEAHHGRLSARRSQCSFLPLRVRCRAALSGGACACGLANARRHASTRSGALGQRVGQPAWSRAYLSRACASGRFVMAGAPAQEANCATVGKRAAVSRQTRPRSPPSWSAPGRGRCPSAWSRPVAARATCKRWATRSEIES